MKVYQLTNELSGKDTQLMIQRAEITELKKANRQYQNQSSETKNMDNKKIQQVC